MPTVPRLTQRKVLPQVGPTAFQEGASAEAFGSITGKALVTLGSQVAEVGEDVRVASLKIQDADNKREFKKLDTEFSQFVTSLSHGDGTAENTGFLSKKGEAAISAFPDAQRAIQAKRKELLGRASNAKVKEAFTGSSQQRQDKAISTYLATVAAQRKAADNAVTDSRIQEAEDAATAAWSDRDILERSLVIVEQETADKFKDMPEEVIASEIGKARSALLNKVISSALSQDTAGAEKILDEFETQIDGVNRAAIRQRIDVKTRQEVQDKIRAQAAMVKAHKDRQEAFFNQMAIQLTKPEGLSEEQITFQFQRGNLNVKQRDSLMKLARDDGTVTDEVANAEALRNTLLGNLSFDKILELPNISSEDKQVLLLKQDEVNRRGSLLAREDIKRLQKTIDERIGGVRGPLAILSPGQSARVSAGIEEFQNRVVGGEDPITVRDDVLRRFGSAEFDDPKTVIETLPNPRFWSGTRQGKRKELLERHKEAHRQTSVKRNTMSKSEFIRELRTLEQWKLVIERMPE
jgi:hypothetical protein